MSNPAIAFLGLLVLIIIPLGIWKLVELIYYGFKAFRQGRFRFRPAHKSISNGDLKKRIKDAKKGGKK